MLNHSKVCGLSLSRSSLAVVLVAGAAANAQVVRQFEGHDCRIGTIPAANTILPPLPPGHPGGGDDCAGGDHTGCGKASMYKALLARLAEKGQREDEQLLEPAENLGDTDLIDNNFDVDIDPNAVTIAGSNTMTLRSMVNGLTEFTFRLRSNGGSITNGYTISSVVINGTTTIPGSSVVVAGTYGRRITLDRAYNSGEIFTVKVNYSGTPRSVGLGSFSIGATTLNNLPFAGSLAEPYYAASIWPVKDGENGQPGDNADKSTATISLTVPNGLRGVANGILQSTTPVGTTKTKYTWRTNLPTATYLYAFGIHAYNVYDYTYNYPLSGGGTGAMPFQINISPPSDTANNRNVWAQSLQMLETFRPVFGLYPFASEKYGIYQFTFGGGMEHQTITGMGGTFSESVTAHELGHQWWGDDVTCRTWNDIWVNEGFATYSEALWYERKPGSAGISALHSSMAARRPSNLTATTGSSAYCFDVTSPNNIFSSNNSYRKGGWALHQLRKIVGDTTFFQILANYRAAFSGTGATTQNFSDIASSTHGSSLQWYIDQSVLGQGTPAYLYGSQAVTVNGQHYLKLHIRQTQSTAMGANNKFTFPIDIRVDRTGGNTTYVVWNDERQEHFVIPLTAPATGMGFDEFNWILSSSRASEAYINGPAKVVQTLPAPGSTAASGTTQVRMTFSEPVTASLGQFTITGPGGAVPFTFSYDAPTNTAVLTANSAFAGGTYTVTALDTITTVASGQRIDGEMSAPSSAGSLPSGDGLALGNAVFTFTVDGCVADFNGDATVDFFDYLDFVAAFSSNASNADFNADTSIDFFDYLDFVAAFSAGCP